MPQMAKGEDRRAGTWLPQCVFSCRDCIIEDGFIHSCRKAFGEVALRVPRSHLLSTLEGELDRIASQPTAAATARSCGSIKLSIKRKLDREPIAIDGPGITSCGQDVTPTVPVVTPATTRHRVALSTHSESTSCRRLGEGGSCGLGESVVTQPSALVRSVDATRLSNPNLSSGQGFRTHHRCSCRDDPISLRNDGEIGAVQTG